MILTELINADGAYKLNNGQATVTPQGMLVAINLLVGHTVALGYYLPDDTFQAFEGTAATFTEDSAVFAGPMTILGVSVSGVTPGDDLQFGFSG